jgi:hypothetical protein
VRDAETDGGVLKTPSVRPLNVGSGKGGRIGEDPPSSSAVEVVEKAGEVARSGGLVKRVPGVFSAGPGGGDEGIEVMVLEVYWTMT